MKDLALHFQVAFARLFMILFVEKMEKHIPTNVKLLVRMLRLKVRELVNRLTVFALLFINQFVEEMEKLIPMLAKLGAKMYQLLVLGNA